MVVMGPWGRAGGSRRFGFHSFESCDFDFGVTRRRSADVFSLGTRVFVYGAKQSARGSAQLLERLV